jgi:flagellar protein FlaI
LIIVGEVRGEEAYVLFQALATGHGGLCTMHADDAETAIKRLTQPPMNIPSSIISLMNCLIVVKQVRTPALTGVERRTSCRKFVRISEIDNSANVHDIFSWRAAGDVFQEDLGKSLLLKKIADGLGIPMTIVVQELQRRKQLLLKMVEMNLRDFRSVHKALSSSASLLEVDSKDSLEE